MTLTILFFSEKTPSSNVLQILLSGIDIPLFTNFNILVGAGPQDLVFPQAKAIIVRFVT